MNRVSMQMNLSGGIKVAFLDWFAALFGWFVSWLVAVVGHFGYAGIVFLMFL